MKKHKKVKQKTSVRRLVIISLLLLGVLISGFAILVSFSLNELRYNHNTSLEYANKLYSAAGFTEGFTKNSAKSSQSERGFGKFYIQQIFEGKGDAQDVLKDMRVRLSRTGFVKFYEQTSPI